MKMNRIERLLFTLMAWMIIAIVAHAGVLAQNQKKVPNHSNSAAAPRPVATATTDTTSSTLVLPIFGSGTTNFIPLWTGRVTIGNSLLSQTSVGLNVAGSVSATSFAGNGAALINVNALTLQGLSPTNFAQTGATNTFTGDQTFNGNLNVSGFFNSALSLQGGLMDSLGEEGANVNGGFQGDANFPGNSIAPGVIGATIAGGGGAYDQSTAPQPQVRKQRPRRGQKAESEALSPETQSPPTGITSGANVIAIVSNWATIGGGLKNTASASFATVEGGYLNTASGIAATVSGGEFNTASGDQSFVGSGYQNSASGNQSTVAGGSGNNAQAPDATIGGGTGNVAASEYDTVGGGQANYAGTAGSQNFYGNTVAGGDFNTANNIGATVGGGDVNTATGQDSTVPGGTGNSAMGQASFAAGFDATANYAGSFVWSSNGGTQDTGPNQFVASAPGGFYFYTSPNSSTGATLPSGSGSWSSLSDRNVKANFSAIDGQTLLVKLAAMPIGTWNYKAQASAIRHMGPTAQDFHAAFNLGEDDQHISNIDSEGVALAGLQTLYKLNLEKDGKINDLTQALTEKSRQIEDLEHRLSRLETLAEQSRPASISAGSE